MKTSVTGFPRVGTLRELKFSSEQYFRGEITADKLEMTAQQLREAHWKCQKESGIDFIASNDFSFYDMTLDTAFALNVIPERYRKLKLSQLDTYFTMARGYQGKQGDVKALAMKKWFNTNYHYLVPELEDSTNVTWAGTKAFQEYKEAQGLGVETKTTLIGIYTFLKLVRCVGTKEKAAFVNDFIEAYQQFLRTCDAHEIQWVQLEEPCLVQDMDAEEIKLFQNMYQAILEQKGNCKVLLQTYFGDIRDVYQVVTELPFDGIGLDFVEGKKTRELVQKYGFPKDKILFAGVVNGKNIWRNHYKKTIALVKELQSECTKVVIGTSCSLLHVPYTLEHETKLAENQKQYFAFAKEKLEELRELKTLLECVDYEKEDVFLKNEKLFQTPRDCHNETVQKLVAGIQKEDCIRLPQRSERQKLQREKLALPSLPTTTIGSFPQTADVKANRSAYKRGEISTEQYVAFNRKKIAECVRYQETIGLDVLVHGEYERNDMVEYFGESLSGYVFTEKAWVQSYGTRCVKPPIIWGDVSREKPMTVEWSVYAQSLTAKPMKGMLTGPVTILNWSFPREDVSFQESAYQIALAIREEVLDLEKNGITVIQIDEAALREKLPLRQSDWQTEYLDWAIPAFRLVHSGVKADTQIHTHMCYSEFTDIIQAIDDMDADVITFEASRSDLLILDALQKNHFETETGPGVYDIHSPRVPSVDEIKAAIHKMNGILGTEKLWVNPDCGLKTRGEQETKASLENLVEAARQVRAESSQVN